MNHTSRFNVAKLTSYVNAVVNTLLAIFKIVIGWLGNSTALIADGIHSFFDLISDGLVLIAAKVGAKNPDAGHPYGHQRIETIAAIVIALLFFSAGAYIVYDAIVHIIEKTALHKPSIAVIIVALVSVIANEWLFRYTLKKGKSIHSNLVIANAWHNRSDVYVSLIVLLSVGFTFLGWHYFDVIGAVLIALFIVKMGLTMIWSNINELIDAAVDDATLADIRHIIEKCSDVKSVHQLRTRLHSGSIFIDVHVMVSPKISVSEGHHISEQVQLVLTNQLAKVLDVTVHIDPEDDETSRPSLNLPTRCQLHQQLESYWRDLPGYDQIERIQLHYLDGKLQIELVLPLHCLELQDAQLIQRQYQAICQKITFIKRVTLYFVSV